MSRNHAFGASERIAAVLALIDQHGTLQAFKMAETLKWPAGTLANYLRLMQKRGLIVPDDPNKSRFMFWSRPGADGKPSVMPEPAALAPVARKYKKDLARTTGKPIVRKTKAADFRGVVPVDPMIAILFGARKAA